MLAEIWSTWIRTFVRVGRLKPSVWGFGTIVCARGSKIFDSKLRNRKNNFFQIYNYVAIKQRKPRQEEILEQSRHQLMFQKYHSDPDSAFRDLGLSITKKTHFNQNLDPSLPSTSQTDRLLRTPSDKNIELWKNLSFIINFRKCL